MKNSSYWKKRFKDLEESVFSDSMAAYKGIEPYFDEMQKDLDDQISVWLARIAKNNNISISEARKLLSKQELKEFKWTVEQYIKAGEENAIDGRWMKQLENASAKAHISRLEAIKIQIQQAVEKAFGNEVDAFDKAIAGAYEKGYYRTAYLIQTGTGVGASLAKIDTDKLSTLIRKPWADDGKGFSDRIWTRKTQMTSSLQNALMRTCAMGEAPDKAAATMEQFVDKSVKNAKSAALRLVQTESAYFAEQSKKKCYNDLDVKEFEVVETLDLKTCDTCADMDGTHAPVKDMEPGVNAPPFHPRCRGTTCPYFDDEFTKDEKRNSRSQTTGKSVQEVPADMNYNDWHDKYVDKISEDDIIKLSPEEVKKYNEKLGNRLTRIWYKAQDEMIPGMVDESRPLKEQAQQAAAMRNRNRTQARDLMKDQKTRKWLDQTYPNKSFDELIDEKKKIKGLKGDAVYKDIIRSSATTNRKFDKKAGV